MLEKLRQMAIFAKTVDHGSFRAAARALSLSPSVISHHISQLEQQLGVALLYRSTRKLSLTPDGERLLAAAQEMLTAAEHGFQEVVSQSPQPSGLLRITVPAFLAQSGLTDLFARFAHNYPKVELIIDFSDVRRELIAEGYDLALSAGQLQDSALKHRKLFKVERRLAAAPSYLDSRSHIPESPEELSDWDWVLLSPVRDQKLLFYRKDKTQRIGKKHSRISVNSIQALQQLTRAGAGIALMPEFMLTQDIATGQLRYVLPEWTVDAISVYAIWPANAPKHGLLRHFVNYLAEHSQESPTGIEPS